MLAGEARRGEQPELGLGRSALPDGVFVEGPSGVAFVAAPAPTALEVERVAKALVRRTRKLLKKHGLLEADLPPEDGLEVLKLAALSGGCRWGRPRCRGRCTGPWRRRG